VMATRETNAASQAPPATADFTIGKSNHEQREAA
jgi:hypothetical protein